jgi:predicted nucleotidyltransferase
MSIASALFADSQARVLSWVFGQPERRYHLSELRRLTGLGSASLQRELNRLAEAGLVLSEKVGNQRQFQANRGSPVYLELEALTRKTLGAEPLLREALTALGSRLEAAWLYGSVAKGNDTAASDVDLMLVGDGLGVADVLECLAPVEAQLGRKINPTCYTPREFARRRADPGSFVNRVFAQPVVPLIGADVEPVRAR